MGKELLKVEDLCVYYSGGLFKRANPIKAVDGISFSVDKGESVGIVGESGCGKSTTGYAITHLIKPTSGKILFNGDELKSGTRLERLNIAKKLQLIFQNSTSSLNPRFSVGRAIEEPLLVHKMGNKGERRERALELIEAVGLKPDHFDSFPHELSGGQRQRIGIARALSLNPELIVCDEPVSALDVSVQAQILNLMKSLQKKYNLTYIFISHNLPIVQHFCDKVIVMYLGHIVEMADRLEIFKNPIHPYTKALISSIPIPDPKKVSLDEVIEGDVPSPQNPPPGCPFSTRCQMVVPECSEEKPPLKDYGNGHLAACFRV
ncbi:MAG: ATP-binding cassette domain-containing protein [Defluviitaleaceae bacterium]|nr:ATP-binding cassette domain-containing protein [Defluviitaleaceae bacterium]